MKMYKKSDLTLNHGLLVSKDGDIILPDIRIVDQANRLETLAQQSAYLMTQPEATPMPSLDGFKRVSIKDDDGVKFTATTPLMDQKAKEAMAIMDELDDVATVKQANNMLHEFAALLEFVGNDFVIDCGNELYCFDTPTIGNVLELTDKEVTNAIAYLCGMTEDSKGDPEKKRIYESELSDEEFETLLGIIANHDEEVAKIVAENKADDEE